MATRSTAVRPASYEEARARLLNGVEQVAPIELPLQEAVGCVLAADVLAEADVPAFSSAKTDGFAVRASDIFAASDSAPASLSIVGRALVGRPPEGTVGWGEAVRIAAGAPMPAGSDCVVPLRDSTIEGETVRILRSVAAGEGVRPAGEELRAGQTLIPAGRKLAAPELALLAASGRPSALVRPRPRTVVVAVDDALVEPGRPLGFGQVRDAKSITLFGALKELGAVPYAGGIAADDVDALKEEVLSHLATADCYIASGRGAVSRDTLQVAFFRRAEVDVLSPGTEPEGPVAFGIVEGKPFFGLPGDAHAAYLLFELLVRPALLRMMGRRDVLRPEVDAQLGTDLERSPDRVRLVGVRVRNDGGRWIAEEPDASGGELVGLAGSNGIALVQPGRARARAGTRTRVMVLRPLER